MKTINELTGQAKAFAEACYDTNSIAELEASTHSDAKAADMREWGITEQEWDDATQAALNELREDAE